MFRKLSIFWIVLLALVVTSALPLGVMAVSAIRTTEEGVEQEQILQLQARADAHGDTIDEQFKAFSNATSLAAAQAEELLIHPEAHITPEEMAEILSKYQRDANNVYGLDIWYDNIYYPQYQDNRQSNAFLNNKTPLTPEIALHIAVTEKLNPVFGAITDSGIGTQWIYLTLPSGMMRLYPWHPNSYPVDWEPHTISFYTVAAPDRNPDRQAVWTAPYNDFAGAGLMVTNSVPIYDGDELMAVMSHDLRIADLQKQVLGFKVGEQGLAFLLDKDGNIVAHRHYAPEDTPLGEELSVKLGQQEPAIKDIVDAMLIEKDGVRKYTDANGVEWVVVYTTVESTDWHLGLMQPRDEIIAPAINIARQLQAGAVALVIVIVAVSVWLARRISRPLLELSNTAKQIEASVDREQVQRFNSESLSQITGGKEIADLVVVFSEMVNALQKRMGELRSVYAMGQTITSTLDYDKTLQSILSAVEQVIEYDAGEISVISGDERVVEAWRGKQGYLDTTGRKYKNDKGPSAPIVLNKSPLLIPTLDGAEKFAAATETAKGDTLLPGADVRVRSFVGVPLTIHDRLIGTITLVHHRAQHFGEGDKRLLNNLAAQASIAIENALQVRQRESALKAQIRNLQIEIDEAKKAKQVEEIVETEYFQKLKEKATQLRRESKKT